MAQRRPHLKHLALLLVLSACGEPLLNDLPELKGPSGPLKNPTAQSAYRGKGFVQKEEEKTIDYSISEENNVPNAQPLEPLVPEADETTTTQVDDNLVVETVHTEIEPIIEEEVIEEEVLEEEVVEEEAIVEEAIVEEVIVE
ncbi:MAG: hypothetical protein QGI45_16255 [Myxococcota bacterium]|nr:hypothetical protein [Myxococcota bacterium]